MVQSKIGDAKAGLPLAGFCISKYKKQPLYRLPVLTKKGGSPGWTPGDLYTPRGNGFPRGIFTICFV